MKCVEKRELLSLLSGQLPVGDAELIERHIAGCKRCAREHDQLVGMTRLLAPDAGEFDDPALARALVERITRVAPAPSPPERRPLFLLFLRFGLALVPVAAVLLALVLLPRSPATDEAGFGVRGSGDGREARISVALFEAAGGEYRPVQSRVRADRALAFAYQNGAPDRYRYLMIFGVDPRGQVFWYYPAYQRAGENPTSVPILGGAESITLPDAVRHDLSPGALRIFALFSREPLEVSGVEARLASALAVGKSAQTLERLDIPGTAEESMLIEVLPPGSGAEGG